MPQAQRRRSPRQAFHDVMGRDPGRVNPFQMSVSKPKGPLDPGALFHYWYPERDGVEKAPDWFASQLKDVSEDLRCCRPPAGAPIRSRCWLVWYRKPAITHYLSPGWLLILAWHAPNGDPLPLDNRVLANLYMQSAQVFGDAKKYFDHILETMQHDKQAEEKNQQTYRHDRAKDLYKTMQISTAGRGNRFARHHDGTVLPSRGESNWNRENADTMLPSEILKAERERRIPLPKSQRD